MSTSAAQTSFARVEAWERKFRFDFASDGGARFEPLLERFGLSVDEEAMLEGTIDFVAATAALAALDGVDLTGFLSDQRYDGLAAATTYSIVFDVVSRGAARLLVAPDLKSVDLADLYEYPWHRLERAGYSGFWISRLDGNALALSELEELDRLVTDDITFDYGEEEISINFDPDSFEGSLAVTLYDILEE